MWGGLVVASVADGRCSGSSPGPFLDIVGQAARAIGGVAPARRSARTRRPTAPGSAARLPAVDTIGRRLRLRLLPALLTALGVALLATGLMSLHDGGPGRRPSPRPLADVRAARRRHRRDDHLPGAASEPDASSPTFPAGPGRDADRDPPARHRPADHAPDRQLRDLPAVRRRDVPAAARPARARAARRTSTPTPATGMFLPLLRASQKNNGKRMLGMTVEVYTSDDWRYLYTITEVRRHTRSLDDAFDSDDRAPVDADLRGPGRHGPEAPGRRRLPVGRDRPTRRRRTRSRQPRICG